MDKDLDTLKEIINKIDFKELRQRRKIQLENDRLALEKESESHYIKDKDSTPEQA